MLADLKSSSCIDCCELAGEGGILVASRCLDGSRLHLTHNSNLQKKLNKCYADRLRMIDNGLTVPGLGIDTDAHPTNLQQQVSLGPVG